MLDRRVLIVTCAALSLVLHVVLLVIAPNVPILQKTPVRAEVLSMFEVRLLDDLMVGSEQGEEAGAARELSTRPGSIEDILGMRDEALKPGEDLLAQPVDVPDLERRVGQDERDTAPDLGPSPDLLREMDAKIIEIEESTARSNIDVARRLVRPSPHRIVREGESPVLRSPEDMIGEEVLLIDPLAVGGGSGGPGGGGSAGAGLGELPEVAEGPLPPREPDLSPLMAPVLPELPIEQTVARSDVGLDARDESRFEFMDDLVNISLDVYMPPGERDGFFRLRIEPKENEAIEVLPKDVTFVVDASSSILQRKLDQSVKGVQRSIGTLRPEDRFNVVVFRDTPTSFRPDLTAATDENKKAADEFLEDLEAKGETDVYRAIEPVVQTAPREGAPGIVLVVSDGRPTSGIRDGRTIINAITDENDLRNSIYAYGGGRTVNRPMLDLLAYRNKGVSEVTPSLDAMDSELPAFFSQLHDPILVDCAADFGRVEETHLFPKNLPDFYRGQAVTVYGKFDPTRHDEFAMRLTGKAGSREKEVVFKADLREAQTADDSIAREWAFRKIYDLIGEMYQQGEDPQRLAELRALSKQYNINTTYD